MKQTKPYGSICHTYHLLKYSSPNRSIKQQEPHKRANLSESGGLAKRKSGEWVKSRKGSDRKNNRTRQKNKREDIEKWDQTDSPEIPDESRFQGDVVNPWPPFGGLKEEYGS